MRHALRTTLVSGLMAGGLVLAGGAAPAAAASGYVTSPGGKTTFNDSGDIYTVCDTAKDGMSAVGWIEVRQANGSWYKHPVIKATGGKGDCVRKNVDVKREKAQLKIVSCRQDIGAGGGIYNCYRAIIPG